MPDLESREHMIPTDRGPLHATEYPGEGPPIVLTHGYPDDSRIYRRLVPELAGRHVITFDFLGHGRSGRNVETGPLEPGRRESELAAVVETLGLERPVLVGHDASGPVVIEHALARPDLVGGLVLLNTYFGDSPTLEFPEFIRLLADAHLGALADAVIADPQVLGWMLLFTDRRLNQRPADADGIGVTSVLPQFVGDAGQPNAIPAIRAWTADLFPGLARQAKLIAGGELAQLGLPVRVAFGADDPYFTPVVAEHLASLLTDAQRHTITGAAHWPQWDQPAEVAHLLLTS